MNTPHNMNSSTSHHSKPKARFRKSTFCWGFLLCMGGIFFCIYLHASKNIEIKLLTRHPVQENFLGVNAIYHCFAPMNDNAGRRYTPEQCQMEYDRAQELGVRIARTYYRYEFAYNDSTGTFDWESPDMQSFYSFCEEMKKRGIDIALQACWWQPQDVLEGPFNKNNDPEEAIRNYTAFMSETLHQCIELRGLTNIRYLVLFTEPQRGADAYSWWLRFSSALHERLLQDGRRKYVQFVGPNEGSTTTSTMLKWAVPHTKDFIDIYSSHNYHGASQLDLSDIRHGKFVMVHGCPTHCRTQQKVSLKPNTDYEMSLYCKIKANFTQPMEGDIMFGALDLEEGSQYFKCMPPESAIHEGSTIRIPYTGLSPEWKQYRLSFNSQDRGDCYIGFFFNIYQDGAIGLFSDISLKEKGQNEELLRNGDFQAYTDDWEQFGSYESAAENYYNWTRWAEVGMQYLPEGKDFWFDEYNWRGGIENPLLGTEIATAQAAFMNTGVQTSLLWSLFDQQWPNNHTTSDDSFYDGEHHCGLMPNLRKSLVPYPAYYAFGLLAHYLGGGEGTKVFACEDKPGRGLYSTATLRPDGNYTILVVNRSGKKAHFHVDNGMLPKATLHRHLYDPRNIHPDENATRIPSDKDMTRLEDTLDDYTFAIYTTLE